MIAWIEDTFEINDRNYYFSPFFSFQLRLKQIQAKIDLRNSEINLHNWQLDNNGNQEPQVRSYPYEWLLPENVLNSISI